MINVTALIQSLEFLKNGNWTVIFVRYHDCVKLKSEPNVFYKYERIINLIFLSFTLSWLVSKMAQSLFSTCIFEKHADELCAGHFP